MSTDHLLLPLVATPDGGMDLMGWDFERREMTREAAHVASAEHSRKALSRSSPTSMGGFSDDGTGYNETDTSKEAAEAEKVLLRERIYRILFDAGPEGLADFELKELAAPYEFPAQRRSDLSRQERVRDTGERRLNPEYKKKQIVWSAFDENGNVLRKDPTARRGQRGRRE